MSDTANPATVSEQTAANDVLDSEPINLAEPSADCPEDVRSVEGDDEGPTSSIENIIPLANLKNGWFAMSAFVAKSAAVVQEKAVETYNSESVQNFRQKTSEAVAPAWEKTVEVTAPIWEKNKRRRKLCSRKN